jgi:hypothetical protein
VYCVDFVADKVVSGGKDKTVKMYVDFSSEDAHPDVLPADGRTEALDSARGCDQVIQYLSWSFCPRTREPSISTHYVSLTDRESLRNARMMNR